MALYIKLIQSIVSQRYIHAIKVTIPNQFRLFYRSLLARFSIVYRALHFQHTKTLPNLMFQEVMRQNYYHELSAPDFKNKKTPPQNHRIPINLKVV